MYVNYKDWLNICKLKQWRTGKTINLHLVRSLTEFDSTGVQLQIVGHFRPQPKQWWLRLIYNESSLHHGIIASN